MKLNMTKDEILSYLKKDDESATYLKNITKKYPNIVSEFIDKLSEVDIEFKNPVSLDEVREFVLQLVIQRLRQLSCFGNPPENYVKRVFEGTIKEIKKGG